MLNIKKSILVTSLLMTSCLGANKKYYPVKQCNNQESAYTEYQKCDLTNIKDYYDVIVDNSAKSNKVILWLIGGPMVSSLAPHLNDVANGKETKEIPFEYQNLIKTIKASDTSFYVINQSQYLKQKKFLDGNLEKFTYEAGYKEHLETVDNTYKIIKNLKSQGKKVGLAGGSYGSFVINEYLAKYGDDDLDWILSRAGRLKISNVTKIQKAFDKAFLKYHSLIRIGKNDVVDDSENKKEHKKPKNLNHLATLIKIGLKGLLKDYTKVISDQNLNKTTFLTAEPDHVVGWFHQEEITWAKSRNASVVVINETETKKVFNSIYQVSSDASKEQIELRIKGFAHSVGVWNKAQIKKYYLDPFNK